MAYPCSISQRCRVSAPRFLRDHQPGDAGGREPGQPGQQQRVQGLLADPDRRVGPDLVVAGLRVGLFGPQHPDPVGHPQRRGVVPAQVQRPFVDVDRVDGRARAVQGDGQGDRAVAAAEVQDPRPARSASATRAAAPRCPRSSPSPAKTPPAVIRVELPAPHGRRDRPPPLGAGGLGVEVVRLVTVCSASARVRACSARAASSGVGGIADLLQGQPARRQHRHRRVADGRGRHRPPARPRPAGRCRPRPARRPASAPSSGRRRRRARCTRPRRPAGRRSTRSARRSSSVRMVVAPSRRRQKAPKSRSPSRRGRRLVEPVQIDRPGAAAVTCAGRAGAPACPARSAGRRSGARSRRTGRRSRRGRGDRARPPGRRAAPGSAAGQRRRGSATPPDRDRHGPPGRGRAPRRRYARRRPAGGGSASRSTRASQVSSSPWTVR